MSTGTLEGHTRRYRIFVAYNKGKPHRGYEFTQFVNRSWKAFAKSLGEDVGSAPAVIVLSCKFRKPTDDDRTGVVAEARCQNAFDDWLEKQYGIAPETAPDPWL